MWWLRNGPPHAPLCPARSRAPAFLVGGRWEEMLMARARGVCARAAWETGEQEAAAGPGACSALEGAGGLCPPVLAQTHSCCGVTWARDSMAGNRLFIHPGAAQGPGFAPVGVVLSSSALPSLFAPMPALGCPAV